MSGQKIITASLEGMRVLVDTNRCELQEYDFKADHWLKKDEGPRPLPRRLAEEWLRGWNRVDRWDALISLTGLRAAREGGTRRAGRISEPHL